MDLSTLYKKPHNKTSRIVTAEDLEQVQKDAGYMAELCLLPHGIHKGAFAIAHCQINDTNPLRFFVSYQHEIIINPIITRHTNHQIFKQEGCMSYPDKGETRVGRWNKVEVQYQIIEGGKLSDVKHAKLKGIQAEVYQHEIDHFDGKYIYQD